MKINFKRNYNYKNDFFIIIIFKLKLKVKNIIYFRKTSL